MLATQLQVYNPVAPASALGIYFEGADEEPPLFFFSVSPAVSAHAAKGARLAAALAQGVSVLLSKLEPDDERRKRCVWCPLFVGDVRSVSTAKGESGGRRACGTAYSQVLSRNHPPFNKELSSLISAVSRKLQGRSTKRPAKSPTRSRAEDVGATSPIIDPPPLSEVRPSHRVLLQLGAGVLLRQRPLPLASQVLARVIAETLSTTRSTRGCRPTCRFAVYSAQWTKPRDSTAWAGGKVMNVTAVAGSLSCAPTLGGIAADDPLGIFLLGAGNESRKDGSVRRCLHAVAALRALNRKPFCSPGGRGKPVLWSRRHLRSLTQCCRRWSRLLLVLHLHLHLLPLLLLLLLLLPPPPLARWLHPVGSMALRFSCCSWLLLACTICSSCARSGPSPVGRLSTGAR